MNRRTLLRTGVGALGGGLTAAAGLHVASDDASAQTALSFSVTGDEVTVGADDTVTAVWLDVSVEWAYNLPESAAPDTATLTLTANDTTVATSETAVLFTEANGEESFRVNLLESDALSADALDADGTDVTVGVELTVTGGGDTLASERDTDTAPVTVTRESVNASAHGRVGGSGSLTVAVESGDSA